MEWKPIVTLISKTRKKALQMRFKIEQSLKMAFLLVDRPLMISQKFSRKCLKRAFMIKRWIKPKIRRKRMKMRRKIQMKLTTSSLFLKP
jgi:hypothetical protein